MIKVHVGNDSARNSWRAVDQVLSIIHATHYMAFEVGEGGVIVYHVATRKVCSKTTRDIILYGGCAPSSDMSRAIRLIDTKQPILKEMSFLSNVCIPMSVNHTTLNERPCKVTCPA